MILKWFCILLAHQAKLWMKFVFDKNRYEWNFLKI